MTASTVLFLHGGTAGGWMWEAQQAALEDRPSYAPDLPGYLSRRGEPWTTFDGVADVLAADIRRRGEGPVDLVGLSMGGIAALHLAARHPDLVASAFVTGVSVLPYQRLMKLVNRATLAVWNRRFFWAAMARSFGMSRDAAAEFLRNSPPLAKEGATAQLREVEPGGVTELGTIAAPVLAIVGEREPSYFHRSLAELQRRIPRALTGVAPGMHHGWSGEDPALFTRILRTWLDSRSRHPDLLPVRPAAGRSVR